MAFGEFFTGTPARTEQFAKFTPQQQAAQNQILQQLLALLQQNVGGQPNYTGFEPVEQRARTQFQSQTIPSLAERFTAMGSGGSQRSSAFQGALGSAASGLEQGLAALRAQYGLQQQGLQQNNLANLLRGGFQPSFESSYFPRQPGFLENVGTQVLPSAARLGASYLTGGLSGLF